MKKSFEKIIVLLMIIGLNWFGLSAVVETIAYYNDIETSPNNLYTASTLDFSLNSPGDFFPEVTPTATSSRSINLVNDGLLGFNYSVSSTSTSGVLCDHLNLIAKLDGSDVYSGSIAGFNYNAGEFSTTTDNNWQFIANLTSNDPALQNQTCHFDFVFDGAQIEGAGFSDQETISNTINSGVWQKVVINKVYYDVDSRHGAERYNEWIEIYNPEDTVKDISGWKICDNDSCDIIPVSSPIPTHGFAIITASSTTWRYWDIPVDTVKIVLDSYIGSGLNNNNDSVILKMPNGAEIDAMSYDDGNRKGQILARIPTGTDTDTASDWHYLGLPSVTVVWPNGGETLWVGRTHNLQWTASTTNPSGSAALSIDIWYSKDSGATWAKIATSTENDGVYNWRVPLFIDGYYVPSSRSRIKVVAFGPENFMVQNWDMSDADFCPPIDYSLLTPEELEYLKKMGMIEMNSPIIEETPTTTPETTETANTTLEAITTEAITTPEVIVECAPPSGAQEGVEIPPAPPAIEQNPPVIEPAPASEEPTPPPPPPPPSPEPEPEPSPTPDPNL